MEKSIESQREPAPQGKESPINASIAQAQPAAVQMKSALQESAAQETLTMAEKENQEEKMPDSLAEVLADLDAKGITDYRRYAAVKNYLCFKARDKGVPIAGTFELTPLCNLDCKMCYVHLTKEQMDGRQLLTVGQWKDLMCQAIDAGMMYASLTGGECLTYPGFDELYLYLQSRGVQVSVLTNGILLTKERIDFFREHPVSGIQVTLYGSSESVYERVTGHRSFQIVLDHIKLAHACGLPMRIGITPNNYSTDDGKAVLQLLSSLELPYNINPSLFDANSDTGRIRAEFDIKLDDYIELVKFSRQLKHAPIIPVCENDLPQVGGDNRQSKPGVRCGAGKASFTMCWNGVMQPCTLFHDIQEDAIANGFLVSWERINAAALRYPSQTECNGCKYARVCIVCPVMHAQGAPLGHANPEVCAQTRRMVEEGLTVLQSSGA